MADLIPVLAAALAVFAGAALQRSTGMGFALVSAPFMMLALGPVNGILVTNLCGGVNASTTALQLRRDIDWPRARWLIPAGIVGSLPGALLVRALSPEWVGVVVGGIVLVALLVSLATPHGHLRDSRGVRVVAGLVSGFMNTSAAVGGPAIAVYTRSIGWARAGFAATASLIFAVQSFLAVALKAELPHLGAGGWALLAAAIAAGMVAGQVLHSHLDDRAAMRTVMALALAGTLVALGKAIWGLAAA